MYILVNSPGEFPGCYDGFSYVGNNVNQKLKIWPLISLCVGSSLFSLVMLITLNNKDACQWILLKLLLDDSVPELQTLTSSFT